jgi:SAM-dependent methyltransferase
MHRQRELYTMGYGPIATGLLTRRSAKDHVGFFLAQLKPGMRVLDGGCGPGTVTLGLAEAAFPGQVIGMDIELSVIDRAARTAQAAGATNLSFSVADIYDLPHQDNSFDAILISALLGNLKEPMRGLEEAYRVLKPGGIIGVKEFDHGGDIIYPEDPLLLATIDLYHRFRRHNGHDPHSGRKTPCLLAQTGFDVKSAVATYSTLDDPEQVKKGCQAYAELIREAWADRFFELGWANRDEIDRMIHAWETYPKGRGFFAFAWCEALASK